MKKFIIYSCIILFFIPTKTSSQSDYQEDLHQYITIQAYHLLQSAGYNVPIMASHLGTMSDDGDRSWQTSKITTGAYREDIEDVVFLHGWPYQTNNHFWHADDRSNGDYSLTHLNGVGNYKNAYEKACVYKNGNWYDKDNNPNWIAWDDGVNCVHYFMYYYGLPQFYKDNKVSYKGKYNYITHEYTEINIYGPIVSWVKDQIVWEILGRMCHLLQDQTVPAHAHGDVHWPEGDCYESWTEESIHYSNYTSSTAGPFINPYDQSYGNPFRYLFYLANQLGDHWPSNPSCNNSYAQWQGDNILYNNINGEGTYPLLNQWYGELGTPPSWVNAPVQANWNLNKAISLTASLLYWFTIEAHLTDFYPKPTNLYIVNSPSDRNVYNGKIGRSTAYCSGTNYWFEWGYKRCTNPPPLGNWYGYSNPLHGIWYNYPTGNSQGNIFDIHNDSYSGQGCSEVMTPLPIYTIYEIVRACSNGGGCTDFATTNYMMKTGHSGVGCPYIFTTDESPLVFNPENNLLHKMEFQQTGSDITDRYLLRGSPFLYSYDSTGEEGTLSIVIKELTSDIDHFDYIKLYKFEHSTTTIIGITENNDIVTFDSLHVVSPDFATLNGNVITDNIDYDTPSGEIVRGVQHDQIYLNFPHNLLYHPAIIMEIGGDNLNGDGPILRDYAGTITINSNEGQFITNFSRRDNLSLNIIEIPISGAQMTIENVVINFNRDYEIKYIAIANISNESIVNSELPLVNAKLSNLVGEFNVEKSLIQKDFDYFSLDSSENSALHLNFLKPNNDPSLNLDYILEVNGTYEFNLKKNYIDLSNKSNTEKFKLYLNYPNPFNPKTKISFELPNKEKVELKIYDVLGQEIMTLVSGELDKGYHEFLFDGANLSSGIYFYRLKTDNYVESKKMLLIK